MKKLVKTPNFTKTNSPKTALMSQRRTMNICVDCGRGALLEHLLTPSMTTEFKKTGVCGLCQNI